MHTNQIELVSSQGHGILDQCQDYTTAYVFYQGVLVAFMFWQLWIKLVLYIKVCVDINFPLIWISTEETITGLYEKCCKNMFSISRNFQTAFSGRAGYFIKNSDWEFLFLYLLTSIWWCCILKFGHFNRYIVVSHFNLLFSDCVWCIASFHMLICHLCFFFVKMSFKFFEPFFNWIVCFLFLLLAACGILVHPVRELTHIPWTVRKVLMC